jgi:hypothetical protein
LKHTDQSRNSPRQSRLFRRQQQPELTALAANQNTINNRGYFLPTPNFTAFLISNYLLSAFFSFLGGAIYAGRPQR